MSDTPQSPILLPIPGEAADYSPVSPMWTAILTPEPDWDLVGIFHDWCIDNDWNKEADAIRHMIEHRHWPEYRPTVATPDRTWTNREPWVWLPWLKKYRGEYPRNVLPRHWTHMPRTFRHLEQALLWYIDIYLSHRNHTIHAADKKIVDSRDDAE